MLRLIVFLIAALFVENCDAAVVAAAGAGHRRTRSEGFITREGSDSDDDKSPNPEELELLFIELRLYRTLLIAATDYLKHSNDAHKAVYNKARKATLDYFAANKKSDELDDWSQLLTAELTDNIVKKTIEKAHNYFNVYQEALVSHNTSEDSDDRDAKLSEQPSPGTPSDAGAKIDVSKLTLTISSKKPRPPCPKIPCHRRALPPIPEVRESPATPLA